MKIIATIIVSFVFFTSHAQYVVKDIKSFGAKGDGRTNDQDAFKSAADFFNKRGGNGKLIISKGTYIIGKQTFTGGQANKPAYSAENVLMFSNIKNLTVSGETGSLLKYMPGLRFGAFKPTGEVYEHGNNYFVNQAYTAQIGYCIRFDNSTNVIVSGITMDGNSDNFILGGVYGDVGRQVAHTGIFIQNGKNITLDNNYIHHFGLDGITVVNSGGDKPDSIVITNTTSEYNGRQGLSWVGGNGLYAKNCKFNHTGKGKVTSAPAAGIDIEAEGKQIKNGVFVDCEFVDNSGCGLSADSGNSSDCTFSGCTFWGTTNWSIWVKKPRFTFTNCNIYGSMVHGFPADNDNDATKFDDCRFEDKPYNGKPPYGTYLIESNIGKRMVFNNCTFTSNTKKLCWFNFGSTQDEKCKLNNCNFIINNSNLPANDFVGMMKGASANNCTFTFTDPDAKAKKYYIAGYTQPVGNGLNQLKVLYKSR